MPRTKKTAVQETAKTPAKEKKKGYYQIVVKSADGKTLESIKKQY